MSVNRLSYRGAVLIRYNIGLYALLRVQLLPAKLSYNCLISGLNGQYFLVPSIISNGSA